MRTQSTIIRSIEIRVHHVPDCSANLSVCSANLTAVLT